MIRFSSSFIERAIVFGLGIASLVVVALTALSVSDGPVSLTMHRADLLSGAKRSSSTVRSAITGTSTMPYASYEPRILQLRQPMVLFFSKATDPFSLQHDMMLQSLAAAHTLRIAAYRVDFDSGTGARLAFGVVVPDTFVFLDARGQRTSLLIHPTPDEVRALLTIRSP